MEYKNLSIKNWAVEDRPREKLAKRGVENLSDAELLAILIGSGTKNKSALELSKELLFSTSHNLLDLGKLSLDDLTKFKGIGKTKAIIILAALEIGRRRKYAEPVQKVQISSSKDSFKIFQPLLGDLPHEEFWLMLLNRSNLLIENVCISKGGTSGTVIDTKIILNKALSRLSSAIIVCHNHPSGNIQPSQADIKITEKLKTAASTMDIMLLDHIIIADTRYYSFSDEGKLI
ncbi:MAG: RadC family protein [Bacteroidota bacterium]